MFSLFEVTILEASGHMVTILARSRSLIPGVVCSAAVISSIFQKKVSCEKIPQMLKPSLATVKRLFAVSGNRCAFPECKVFLVDEVSGKVTGRICHIKAHSPKGPRYDPTQTESERSGFQNLILMCPIHHDVIDTDVGTYSVDRLKLMKMNHESSNAAHKTAMDVSDEIANGLLMNVVSDIVGGSVVTSVNQSGGQTANSITNINRQVVLNKSYTVEQLMLDTFAIDPNQCAYEEHRLDRSRPLWPEEINPIAVCYMAGGQVGMYGREFPSRIEAEKFGDLLRQEYNHYSFYEGAPHTIFFERLHKQIHKNSPNYPVFYVSISNHTNSHVVLSALKAIVHQVHPLTAIGESHAVLALMTYKIPVESRVGVYRLPAVPSLKIESGDASAIYVMLVPRVQMMGGHHWFISLSFDFGQQSLETDVFAIVM